jgi:hypothetical protein
MGSCLSFIEQIVDAAENCQLIIVGMVGSDVHHRVVGLCRDIGFSPNSL